MEFKSFKSLMQAQFTAMIAGQTHLYVTEVDKETLWNMYLGSFPEESRQEHNCNCCRQFIKNYGNVVAIKNNRVYTMWEFDGAGEFKNVAHNLHRIVSGAPVVGSFVQTFSALGTDSNVQQLPEPIEGQTTRTWQHLYFNLPTQLLTRINRMGTEDGVRGQIRTTVQVFKRSLEEIKVDAVETVLELIAQNSLYRGAEYKAALEEFLRTKKAYDKLKDFEKNNFCWSNAHNMVQAAVRIRSTAIGTLLVAISEGEDLDTAVTAFERIMAPQNYKRPNAIITAKMVETAEKEIAALGLTESLGRQFAAPEDVSVENLLFVNRDAKKGKGIFEELKDSTTVNPKSFSKVEEISLKDFVANILPKATALQILLENKHTNNLVSLIGPKDPTAPTLFKWDNAFSWSYQNAVADSMKERVKAAGGNVDGVLRYSIQWNEDGRSIVDFDAHAREPNNHIIYFGNKGRKSSMEGMLDVDMINPTTTGVENIIWTNPNKMARGVYALYIHNYNSRHNHGFQAEVEFDGEVHSFNYVGNAQGKIHIADVTLGADGKFTIETKLPASVNGVASRKVWGLDTNQFHKVSMAMRSPNYWGTNKVGNEHLFFMMEGAENEEMVRGFFNEFLRTDLMANKRVFEALGGRMKVEPSHKQLSGLGFSSTNSGEFICKVEGAFTRTLRVKF